jgi:hypothetical protein
MGSPHGHPLRVIPHAIGIRDQMPPEIPQILTGESDDNLLGTPGHKLDSRLHAGMGRMFRPDRPTPLQVDIKPITDGPVIIGREADPN